MRTERVPLKDLVGVVDTGAQYITQDERTNSEHAEIYASLVKAGLLQPFHGNIEGTRAADGAGANFFCPQGVSAIVEHTLDEAGVTLECRRRARTLRINTDAGAPSWDVESADGITENFDAVVVTSVVPHQLSLLQDSSLDCWLESDVRKELEGVEYSSRYAISLLFAPEYRALFDDKIRWVAKYIQKEEDDALVYIGYDSAKREQREGVVSLMAHTSVPYGLRNLRSSTEDSTITSDLMDRLQRLLPWM